MDLVLAIKEIFCHKVSILCVLQGCIQVYYRLTTIFFDRLISIEKMWIFIGAAHSQ